MTDFIRIHTETPLDELWTYYRRLEVVDALDATVGHSVSAENAQAVRDCVRQAREYFQTARSASLLTRPVLIYYGMVSLAKVLLLTDSKQPLTMAQIEALERRGHGLNQFDPTGSAVTYQLEDGTVVVAADAKTDATFAPRGVFPQLALRVCPTGGQAWLRQQFSIKLLLRAIPQLDLQMRQAFGEDEGYTGVWVRHVTYGAAGRNVLQIYHDASHPTDPGQLRSRFSYIDSNWPLGPISGNSEFRVELVVPTAAQAEQAMATEEQTKENMTVLPPALNGERFDALLSQYMVMYALSIVARYKPHRWVDILEGRNSPLLPVVEKLMAVAQRWWPNLVLNRVTNATVRFAGTMYF